MTHQELINEYQEGILEHQKSKFINEGNKESNGSCDYTVAYSAPVQEPSTCPNCGYCKHCSRHTEPYTYTYRSPYMSPYNQLQSNGSGGLNSGLGFQGNIGTISYT